MKFPDLNSFPVRLDVTPYVGVWIEIVYGGCCGTLGDVTPYVGVWIEITLPGLCTVSADVTPYVGVWIEIVSLSSVYTLA